jgi:hypothetical protein
MEALDRIISRLWLANRFGGNMTPTPQETQKGRFVTREQVQDAVDRCFPIGSVTEDSCHRVDFVSYGADKGERVVAWSKEGLIDHLCHSLGIE